MALPLTRVFSRYGSVDHSLACTHRQSFLLCRHRRALFGHRKVDRDHSEMTQPAEVRYGVNIMPNFETILKLLKLQPVPICIRSPIYPKIVFIFNVLAQQYITL